MNIGDGYRPDRFSYAPTVAAALGNFRVSLSDPPATLPLACLSCATPPPPLACSTATLLAHLPCCIAAAARPPTLVRRLFCEVKVNFKKNIEFCYDVYEVCRRYLEEHKFLFNLNH
jgi:hypothetical protein